MTSGRTPVCGDFFALTNARIVDARLRIAIQAGRFELDDSTRAYTIQYDPQLHADRLWCRRSQEDRERLLNFIGRDAAERLIPFISEASIDVVSFSIEEDWNEDTLILKLKRDRSGYLFMRRMIETKIGGRVCVPPDALIAYVIESMAKWYGLQRMGPCEWKDLTQLTFLIDTSFAECLAEFHPFGLPHDGSGHVVFDRRKIA